LQDYALAFGSVNAFASLLGVLVVGDLVGLLLRVMRPTHARMCPTWSQLLAALGALKGWVKHCVCGGMPRVHQPLPVDCPSMALPPVQVRRSGRTSIIVFCLAAVMIAGLASITGFGIPSMIRDFQQGDASLSSACA
jgi:hypothetical protein